MVGTDSSITSPTGQGGGGTTAAPIRILLIGAGGFGAVWVNHFLPAFAGRARVVGIVDINPATLAHAGEKLGVPPEGRFTSMEAGFAGTHADACVIVLQPGLRWEAVSLAVRYGLPILAEKPIADSWETSLAILNLVRESGTKMAVVQNYRYSRSIRTLKSVLDSGALGRVNFLTCRFAADYTIETAGGAFRHQIPYAMLYEGLIHHFDQFRNLSGADGDRIGGFLWNPAWSTFANATTAMFNVRMTNGVVGHFEINHVARGTQNGWHAEGYRVECEHGAVTIDVLERVQTWVHLGGNRLQVTDVEPVIGENEDHVEVIRQFLDWLEGGSAPETSIEDNIHTNALAFAAVEAVRTGQMVDIVAMTRDGLGSITPERAGSAPGSVVVPPT
ncbi:MAG TPA: Gfo/Idh/MocA family oxidoreductase [Thermomicrobiales bacterium]|jgi:predicted dehydrogenase|nr:Gfo/Idh/MocA family oxidoreductase [Thermomicrobiales bacterium]